MPRPVDGIPAHAPTNARGSRAGAGRCRAAGAVVVVIGVPAGDPRRLLDDHGVPRDHEGAHRGGRGAHPGLAGPGLAEDTEHRGGSGTEERSNTQGPGGGGNPYGLR